MRAIEVDGEFIEIVGPRQAKVLSRSQEGLWYAVDLESGRCTCKGWQVRKTCRHLNAVQAFVDGETIPAAVGVELVRFELVTSRYQSKDLQGYLPVGITVGHPRFKLAFTLAGNVREAAPVGFKDCDPDDFERLYRQRVEGYGVSYFRRRFSELARTNDNPRLALLCYEDLSKPGEVCHRRMFASWWQEQTGQDVPELSVSIPETLDV